MPSAERLGIDLRHHLGAVVEVAADISPHAIVTRLSHVEDAKPSCLSWLRGAVPSGGFEGTAIVLSTGELPGWAGAPMVIRHADPRGVMRFVIDNYITDPHTTYIEYGDGCSIHPTAVLGANGQGYDWRDGKWDPFPHAGGLRIGRSVEVGPCSTIMRGSVGDTVIGDGCKIGNGVNIGHDTRVGRNALIVAGVQIAGWVRIGEDVRIWQGALIRNGVSIGDGAEIGMGAVVLGDVAPGEVWAGNPARRIP